MQAGKLELISMVEVPRAARKIRATFCPKVHITEPEYIVMGGEDTSVYIYDISKPSLGPLVITRLQVRVVTTPAVSDRACLSASYLYATHNKRRPWDHTLFKLIKMQHGDAPWV